MGNESDDDTGLEPVRRDSMASRRTIEAMARGIPSPQPTPPATTNKSEEGRARATARVASEREIRARVHGLDLADAGIGDWRLNAMGKFLLFVCTALTGTFVAFLLHWPSQQEKLIAEAMEIAPAPVPEQTVVEPTHNGPAITITVMAGSRIELTETSTPSISAVRKARAVTVQSEMPQPDLVAPLGPPPCSEKKRKGETASDCCGRIVESLKLPNPFPAVEMCERSPETWRPNGRK